MRKLKKPSYTATDVFKTCISKVADPNLKEKFKECIPDIESAANTYETLAKNALLHTFQDHLCNVRRINIKEMKAVYTQRFAQRGGPGYDIYNEFKKNTFNQKCPLCGQRNVSTLDHYLPKSNYPSFVVTPVNLIPACQECNKMKASKTPKSSEEETLHPFFDNLGTERFLFANVIESNLVINFYIVPPQNWSEQLTKRVQYHFNSFKLNMLYSIHAIDELVGQAEFWSALSKESLMKHLMEQTISRKHAHPNSWQTAFYEGMAKNDWFCSGGFQKLIKKLEKEYI